LPSLTPHRRFDRLRNPQHGELLWRDEHLDAASEARLASNETGALEGEDHLMN
jgi:hypothetical protein